jgi:hypothetical protein
MHGGIPGFLRSTSVDNPVMKSPTFWTPVVLSIYASVWFMFYPGMTIEIRSHLLVLLLATSVLFGFELMMLFFCVHASADSASQERMSGLARPLFHLHARIVFCLWVLIAYGLPLWIFGRVEWLPKLILSIAYGLLVFLTCFCGIQILNQILTVHRVFMHGQQVAEQEPETSPTAEASPAILD